MNHEPCGERRRNGGVGEMPFKRCSMCGMEWDTIEAFLTDRSNKLNGYQYNARRVLAGLPVEGFLIFTHRKRRCGTSIAIRASAFRSKGPDTINVAPKLSARR
jgi:hypothetical protein